MVDVIFAAVERELRNGNDSNRAIARRLGTSEQKVRRIRNGQYKPRRTITYKRCKCGGLQRTDMPCQVCEFAKKACPPRALVA